MTGFLWLVFLGFAVLIWQQVTRGKPQPRYGRDEPEEIRRWLEQQRALKRAAEEAEQDQSELHRLEGLPLELDAEAAPAPVETAPGPPPATTPPPAASPAPATPAAAQSPPSGLSHTPVVSRFASPAPPPAPASMTGPIAPPEPQSMAQGPAAAPQFALPPPGPGIVAAPELPGSPLSRPPGPVTLGGGFSYKPLLVEPRLGQPPANAPQEPKAAAAAADR